MTTKGARKARLTMALTEAIRESELPWPEYGGVVAGALSNLLGNPASVCVREDGTAIEFDGEGRYCRRLEKDEPQWKPIP